MAVSDRRFFGRAWASLASTRNVFGKLCLIALLQFVPVLGQMVALGYFLGWVREAAWGMETPMPAHVLSGGDHDFWPRAAKAWVVTLLYGLIESIFACVLTAVWVMFGHMQPGLVDDVALGVLVALGLVGSALLLIFYFVGLVRLAVYNRFGAAWQWGMCLRMAGRDFGGLLKLFFGTVGLNVLISVFVAAIASLMGLAFMASIVASPMLSTLLGSAYGIDGLVSALISLAGALLVALPLFSVLTFFLNVPFLVITAVCWRALGNWGSQFDIPRWGAMADPLPEPREDAVCAQRPVAPTPEPEAVPAAAPSSPATSSPLPVDPASPDEASAPAADGTSRAVPDDQLKRVAPAVDACPAPGYVRPERRSHPVGIIVLCLLGSLVLSVVIGVATACASSGTARTIGSLGIGSQTIVSSGSTSPQGYWSSSDGQAVSLDLSESGAWDEGTFTWFYDASQSSLAQGSYRLNDLSSAPLSEALPRGVEDLLASADPVLGDLADALFDVGVTPATLGIGVYEVHMTADSGMLNGQDATSSVQGNVVNALFIVFGNTGLIIDEDAVSDSTVQPDAVLFVTR